MSKPQVDYVYLQRLPLTFPLRHWLVENFPHDRAYFIAKPTKTLKSGREVWSMTIYDHESQGEFTELQDIACQINLLESLVKNLRRAYGLKKPSKFPI